MITAEEKLTTIQSIVTNPSLTPEAKQKQLETLLEENENSSASKDVNGSKEPEKEAGSDLSTQQRIDLIHSNLQEVLDPHLIEDVLKKGDRPLVIYWGTATTGRPHCGYFVPMLKIASYLRSGCRVKILLADIHGFLDNLKAPIELVQHRALYYRHVITSLLKAVGVSVEKLSFSLGSEHQLSEKYQMDLLRLATKVTIHDAKKAGAEVVKQVENATLSGLIYPLMQALDEEYLNVDAQHGGVDQRKIFTLAKDVLPKVGYRERAHLMNLMVPGLTGGKMSASDPDSKIDVLDPPEVVTKKLKKAFAAPKVVEENGLLAFVQYVLLPCSALHGSSRFEVERCNAEPLVYSDIESMRKDYQEDTLNPQILKPAITKELNKLLAPVQTAFKESKEWQEVERLAYPPEEPEKKKKVKAPKDKGSKFPGNKVAGKPDGSVEGKEKDKEKVELAGSATEAMKELRIEREVVQDGKM